MLLQESLIAFQVNANTVMNTLFFLEVWIFKVRPSEFTVVMKAACVITQVIRMLPIGCCHFIRGAYKVLLV